MLKKAKTTLPIRSKILLIFVLSLFVSVTCFGISIFTNWASFARNSTESLTKDINEEIYNSVYSFMQEPVRLNEINYKIIENRMLDFSDEKQREKFFVRVLESQNSQIYSFSYATINGEYYGARRNENGVIEIMRNNDETNGNSWYYSVNADYTAGERVMDAGKFDPRTRAWYKVAVEAQISSFSPVYKHFVMNDLTVSAAWPIYDEKGELEGVLGTHMLLSDIGSFLKKAVDDHHGIAFILEENSHELIANSLEVQNFTVLEDNTLKRFKLEEIDHSDIQDAYSQYLDNRESQLIYKGTKETYHLNIREMHMKGLDWIVISAIPESAFMKDLHRSMILAALIGLLSFLLSILTYSIFMKHTLKPLKGLLQTSSELASGDLSKRVEIIKDDELGIISKSFNLVADKMQSLVEHLETTVKERTEELKKANISLEEGQDELRLILDSAAEAIYGIDLNGKCTFCNRSCIKMLGYNDESELLGKNMHWLIHHSHKDGSVLPIEDCRILRAFEKGGSAHVEDEVFWRSDGTSISVEYFSYPQIKNGEISGAVITFLDISERKRKEEKIQFLSCHDMLTGLFNRRCYEEYRELIDVPENLPLSVIFADINGLKMTNDVFGHTAGDNLIKKSSEILKQACRSNDVIARVGGDEFIILLPNTTEEEAEEALARIKAGFAEAHIKAVKCSISLGYDTKKSPDQALDEIMANAENAMYKDKTLNRKNINKDIIDTIIITLHERNNREKQHSIIVSELCSKIGVALNLSETEISKIQRAGYLHDIGKIVLDDEILTKDVLSDEELEKMKLHSAVGYRILNLFDDTLDLAEYVYSHHERWDGTGYPRRLKGEQIPLISRIIAITETYDRVLNRGDLPLKERKLIASNEIKNGAGGQFDPKIATLFAQMIKQ